MPFVSATLAVTPSDELTARVIAALTNLTVEILGHDKARYVREVNRALQSLLGEASGYVAVEELPADSWGYAGETIGAPLPEEQGRLE